MTGCDNRSLFFLDGRTAARRDARRLATGEQRGATDPDPTGRLAGGAIPSEETQAHELIERFRAAPPPAIRQGPGPLGRGME
jgi:hypothetical protein